MRCSLLLVAALLAGCAQGPRPVAAPPEPVAAMPPPRPPGSASAGLVLPPERPDGSFATPNQDVSPAARLWHVRVGMNVAALACRDPAIETGYNRWLRDQRSALAQAHRTLQAEYRARHGGDGQAQFDRAMTQLYNYFAQPPVGAELCASAAGVLPMLASGTTDAAAALAAIEAPYQAFYRRYADYRHQVAAWRQGSVRLAVDAAALAGSDRVTAGTQLH